LRSSSSSATTSRSSSAAQAPRISAAAGRGVSPWGMADIVAWAGVPGGRTPPTRDQRALAHKYVRNSSTWSAPSGELPAAPYRRSSTSWPPWT
jgi:hypothetical protein